MKLKKIFLLGGAGYVGSVLTAKLLKLNYDVTVFDLFIYGKEVLDQHDNLTCIEGDLRNLPLLKKSIQNHDAVIHLACISNDPSFELDLELGKSINYDFFEPLIKLSVDSRIKKFIYASSSSVYGIKDDKNVNENCSLEPLTDYSKYKAMCEDVVMKYSSRDFNTTILRPATVCGYSPRQRLDLVVNILTNLGYHKNEISVFGGEQLRPNIHINDMCEAYIQVLEDRENISRGNIYNVGYENIKVIEIAKLVQSKIEKEVKIVIKETSDNRSYHISSEKFSKELGFTYMHTIEKAIEDLINIFDKKLLTDTLSNEMYFNIKRMNSINLK
jgi:nucleoside-diphosphate-sugar epimerase